jgi:CyaY protein
MISDSDFTTAADATLDAIGRALDAALAHSDADVDWTLNDGILEIEGEDGGKLIVNRHVPNREIWVAARAGGYHFRSAEGRWLDTRSGDELGAALARLLKAQAGVEVDLSELRAPDTDHPR